jgi:hypothetical protein
MREMTWRKSSRSSSGSCVEVSTSLPGLVAVRDSKDPHGPMLTVSPTQWREFLRSLR